LTESGLITQFLVDSHPSHLLRSSSDPGGALQRFNVTFFVDSYVKAHCFFDTAVLSSYKEEEATAAQNYIDAIVNTIEPLLADAAPFFGGSSRLTFAEVCIQRVEVPWTTNSLFRKISDTFSLGVGSNRVVPSPCACTAQTCRNPSRPFPRCP
jgi:hypothetical protein